MNLRKGFIESSIQLVLSTFSLRWSNALGDLNRLLNRDTSPPDSKLETRGNRVSDVALISGSLTLIPQRGKKALKK